MKKISLIIFVLGFCLLAACGNDNDVKKDEQNNEQKETTKSNSNKKSDKKDTETEDQKQEEQKEQEKQADKTSEKKSDSNIKEKDLEEKATKKTEIDKKKKESEVTQAKPVTSTISESEFNKSNTLPITGGNVVTVYNSNNPKLLSFGPLNITISKYKVESVVGSDKQIDAYSPESYLGRRDGYVITLDVIIENTTNSSITYKADHLTLNGKDISKGGSKENFIPNDKVLNNTNDEFPSMSKKEGYITYMLNEEDFAKIKQSTTLTASNPNDFNSPSIDVTVKNDITTNFPINK
ncbi:DUF5068 domain-containing protein [Listeria welshimeri]|nr:DUF5068 domain-containing protein [Listeria welshimeri]MBC1345390.1 DUF5068 domain-containing protein [Listeria welshimeri]MBC2302717.1 DUF5068 domain-containing protein [Listeria welshimeri]